MRFGFRVQGLGSSFLLRGDSTPCVHRSLRFRVQGPLEITTGILTLDLGSCLQDPFTGIYKGSARDCGIRCVDNWNEDFGALHSTHETSTHRSIWIRISQNPAQAFENKLSIPCKYLAGFGSWGLGFRVQRLNTKP